MMLEELLKISQSIGTIKIEITGDELIKFFDHVTQKAKEECSKQIEEASKDDKITRKEAMKILNVKTVLTMMRWEEKGYLTPYRLASRIFYNKSEVLNAARKFERIDLDY